MSRSPVNRVAKLLMQGHQVLEKHARECPDRVLAFALHPADHEALAVVELWGIPVLGWDQVDKGRLRLLCEADGVLIPPFETVADIEESVRRQPTTRRSSDAVNAGVED